MRRVAAVVAIGAVALLAGCAGLNESPSLPDGCLGLHDKAFASLQESLGDYRIERVAAVPHPSKGGYWWVAAKVDGSGAGDKSIGLWVARQDPTVGDATYISANLEAISWSSWNSNTDEFSDDDEGAAVAEACL